MNGLDEAERRAETHRAAFAVALEELDRRRKLATDVPYQLRTHAGALVLTVGAFSLGVGAWVVVARLRRENRRALRRRAWVRALIRVWEHPERIASRAADRPLPVVLGRRLLTALVGALAARLVARTVGRLPVRAEAPRLPEGALQAP